MAIINTQLFIALEGIDGAGKTEQVRRLSSALADLYPNHSIQTLREPGNTAAGEAIRQLLSQHHQTLDPITELFLFAAARRQVATELVMPWLHQGAVIIADRYSASTHAYQYVNIRRRLKTSHRETEYILDETASYATEGIEPGLNILLDPDDDCLDEIISRQQSGPKHDPGFLLEVADRYRRLAELSARHWAVVRLMPGTPPDTVAEQVLSIALRHLSVQKIFDDIHHSAPEGTFDNLPADGAENYKHYLYERPKQDSESVAT